MDAVKVSSGSQKGRIVDPTLRRIRYLQIVNDKLAGLTDQQVADKLGLDPKTIRRTLSWGKRNNIIADAEDDLLQKLFPEAERVVKQALAENDLQVAMKLYTMVVKGRDAKPGTGAAVDEDELAVYMARRRKQQEQIENTTEGELLDPARVPAGLLESVDPGELRAEDEADGAAEAVRPSADSALPDSPRDEVGGPLVAEESEAASGQADS